MHKFVVVLSSCIMIGVAQNCIADFSAVAPDGRKILLRDNGTWVYDQPADGKAPAADKAGAEQALLSLEKVVKYGPNCRFELKLVNTLPYEIVQIVPYFSAYRASGAMHQSIGAGFQHVRPTASRNRVVEFNGIDCEDIVRIQVTGGDRCEMGDLTKFSADKGQCLERIGLAPSNLLPFAK